jgi:hypothetical protein
MDDADLAKLLIKAANEALCRGTKHYNKAGELLETPLEIVECLLNEGSVILQPKVN